MTLDDLFKQLEAIMKKAEPPTRDALRGFAQDLKSYGGERDQEIAAKDKQIADLTAQLAAKDKEAAAKDRQIVDLQAQVDAKDKQIADLKAQLAAKDKEIADLRMQVAGAGQVTRASPTDIAKSFRAVIDEFHAEARESDDVGIAIKTLDVEVKGLVEVDDKATTLVLPAAGAAVDPTILSTFRVSFGAVPALPAEEPPATEPK